jgi:hypothetical protein
MIETILNLFWSIMFAFLSTFGINVWTEQPKYLVVDRIREQIEVRQYAPRIAAETTVDLEKSNNPRGDAFQIVAGYIFGSNKQHQKIDMTSPVEIKSAGTNTAMTAPVEVDKSNKKLVMRFVLPASYTIEDLPEPSDPRVRLIDLPSMTFAVLRFSGSTSDSAVSERTEEFLKALQNTEWKVSGQSTAFFYNPPWTIGLHPVRLTPA